MREFSVTTAEARVKRFSMGHLCIHFLILSLTLAVGACSPLTSTTRKSTAVSSSSTSVKQAQSNRRSNEKRLRRKRISLRQNLYEGSLWRYEASFGNILRDHRARFRGDLLTINELGAIVNAPEPKQAKGEEAAPVGDAAKASLVLEAITLRDEIEEEQNEILRNLDTISARVIRVLADGNMMIKGQKIDYRQRNQVRYITTVTGILRPADVDDSNIVSSTKLANPNVQIKRQQTGSLVRERLKKLAPLIGKQQAGLAGRVGEFSQTK